jgi:hypothetical protein
MLRSAKWALEKKGVTGGNAMAKRKSSDAFANWLSKRAVSIILVFFLQGPLFALAQAADLSGSWTLDMNDENVHGILAIQQSANNVTGELRLQGQTQEIYDGAAQAGSFSFAVSIDFSSADHPDNPVTHRYAFSATITADGNLENCSYSVDGDSSAHTCSLVKRPQ